MESGDLLFYVCAIPRFADGTTSAGFYLGVILRLSLLPLLTAPISVSFPALLSQSRYCVILTTVAAIGGVSMSPTPGMPAATSTQLFSCYCSPVVLSSCECATVGGLLSVRFPYVGARGPSLASLAVATLLIYCSLNKYKLP